MLQTSNALNDEIVVSCFDLCQQLENKIGNTAEMNCLSEKCADSNIMQQVLSHTNLYLNFTVNDDKIVIDDINGESFQDYIIHAFVGRFFIAQNKLKKDQTKNIFVTYDLAQDRFFFTLPNCSYQKPLYDSLLFIVIIVLICNLFLQSWYEKEKKNQQSYQYIDNEDNEINDDHAENKSQSQTNIMSSAVKFRLSAFKTLP